MIYGSWNCHIIIGLVLNIRLHLAVKGKVDRGCSLLIACALFSKDFWAYESVLELFGFIHLVCTVDKL